MAVRFSRVPRGLAVHSLKKEANVMIADIILLLLLAAALIGAYFLKKRHKGCCGSCDKCRRSCDCQPSTVCGSSKKENKQPTSPSQEFENE